ncbi:hypothetical protein C8R47DRAFT_1016007 [Mycena vitilis]|nr:hypothetical protein C8R47DRAFT_1016007 [Mycena vitilis]
MFSLLRARLPLRPRCPAFSTTALVRNEAKPMDEIEKTLLQQSARTPLADKGKDKEAEEASLLINDYLPFQPHSFIRPFDLSLEGRSPKRPVMRKHPNIPPSTRDARDKDVFYQLGVDPLKFALHPAIISRFMSEMAKIHPRARTQLTSKSQRRIAKAIRRAKMMGVIPLHSRLSRFGDKF